MSEFADFARLAKSDRAVLVAAAGCGKTHAIAQAVSLTVGKPQLILTHTHAGVAALRRRLHTLGVSKHLYTVETIAGWALKLAASYPASSGLAKVEPESDQEWRQINPAAEAVVRLPSIQRVLTNSFGGVYVDEYQDCTLPQHRLIMAIANTLPCRVLGDPLQGIFGFTNESIDWDQDVLCHFEKLPELDTPWRWQGENEALGEWLNDVRKKLLTEQPIDLDGAPVVWKQISPDMQKQVCYDHLGIGKESVVALMQWPAACHKMACSLGGRYKSMEAIECKDLLKYAKLIQLATGAARVLACVNFAKLCMSNLTQSTTTLEKAMKNGRMPRDTKQKHGQLYDAVAAVITTDSMSNIRDLFIQLKNCSNTHVYREELWNEMERSVDFAKNSDAPDLGKAAWEVRNITRQIGRRERLRLVSRTLLVKGLEYDHVLLLDADAMDPKNLYVALTRAKKTVTVLSKAPILSPYR